MPTLVEKKPISITYDGSGNPTTFVEFEDTVSNRHVVPVIHGGTGADSASGARTALGLGTLSTANSVAVGNLSSNIDATDINFIAAKAAELETARTIHGVSFDGSANIDLSEVIQDTVGAMFSSNTETNITATYQDSDGTIDLVSTDTTLTTEEVQDIVGAQIVTNGSHTGISFAYDDANDGAIDATVSLSGFSTSDLSEGTNLYYTSTRANSDFDTRLATKDTDDLSEGTTNLYYTDARFDTRLGTKDTDDLTEGSTNLYFTDEKAQDAVGGMLTGNTETLITVTYDDANALINFVVDNDLSNYDNSTSGFITATLTQEEVEDFVGGMVSGNTETLIGVTYDDTNGKLDFVVDNDLSNYSNTSSAFITLTSLSGSTGVTYDNTTGAISIGQDVGTSSDVQFNDVTVAGDLTVNGTTTTVSSTNTEIADKLIELANGATGTPSGDSGIVIERGTADNAFIGFDESVDKFIVGTGTFTGASTGNLTITTGTLVANLEGNVTGTVSSISNFDTDDLSEGSTNLYYTNARFDTQLGTKDTDNLTEGSTNLYYTDARTNSAFDTRLGTKDTDDLTEGSTNLYFTDARAQSAITGSTGINVSSGAVSIDNTVATLTGSQTLTNKTINLESNTVIVEYAVTVSGGNFLIDGEANATISFRPGVVHRFDLSDSSTSSHPFKLSTTSDGSHNSGSEYTTGKTSNGSQGSSGAYVEYTVNASTPDILYYYCSSHSGMGGTITVFGSAYGDADVQSYLSAGTGISLSGSGVISSTITQYADSDVQSYLSAGAGISISGSGQISSTITQYADSDVQSYLSGGNGITLSGSGAFSVDATVITGQTAETSIADDDLVLIYDSSATALKKMTKANFVAGLSGGGGTVTEAFRTIAVSGQSDVVADSATDSLTFAAGSNVTITTNASTDTVTIASTDTQLTQEQVEDFVNGVIVAGSNITKTYDDAAGTLTIAATGGAANAFSTLAVSGQSDVVADATTDTLTLSAGTGMTITTDASTDTITFASSGGGGNTIPFTEFDGTTDNIVLGGSTTFATLADADGDTEIDLERTSDNDSIIFKAGGTDVMTATSSGVTVATQSSSDNSTKIATTAYVTSALGGISSNSVADADSDTKIQVEESSDEDIIRVDTAGQERLVMDNNVSMAARGGFFTHNLAMHASETFTIAATEGTVAAGPLDVQGTVDVQGSLVVL